MGPDAAALVYAAWCRARTAGTAAKVILPDEPPQLRAFCEFVGLDHLLGEGRRPKPTHISSETLPLHQFYEAGWTLCKRLTDMVARHYELNTDEEAYLQNALNEVMSNVQDHARSAVGGFVCARYFKSKGQLRVAAVDHGVGIGRSLQVVQPGISTAEAVRRVLQGGFTSNPTGRNQGLGLSNLAGIVRNMAGDLAIFTQDTAAHLSHSDQLQIEEGRIQFPGTAVFFRLGLGPA